MKITDRISHFSDYTIILGNKHEKLLLWGLHKGFPLPLMSEVVQLWVATFIRIMLALELLINGLLQNLGDLQQNTKT